MGTYKWLSGPLLCLILATTLARPPECEESPSWSINGRHPLEENKGKASLLETLLTHFRSYGLNDLEFIIVNSKLSHSQASVHELKNRVSFEVFQETDEEEVWSLMEGGKDDMYVYDRCGRLTYYIPFPLSILNESPLVANAVLATYFRSPCGDNCDQNKTFELEEFVKNLNSDIVSSNETALGNVTDIEEDNTAFSNETDNEAPSSNDLFNVFDPINEPIIESNTSVIPNITDYDYLEEKNNYFDNNTNSTTISQEKSIFNSIYRLFFNNGNNSERTLEINETITLNYTSNNSYEEDLMPDNFTHYPIKHKDHLHHHKHHHSTHNRKEDIKQKKPSDRCLEADYQVCKSWSKRRLLHAQKCCSGAITREEKVSCSHFGKKRCKKIQSILKCCIKTLYVEPPTPSTTNEPCNETSTEESLNTTTESSTDSSQINKIVCCKLNEGSKTCRVSSSGVCEGDEHVENEHSLKETK